MKPNPPNRSTRIAPIMSLKALPYDSLGMDPESFKRGALGHLEYTLAELPHQVDSEWEPYVAVALAVRDRMVERWDMGQLDECSKALHERGYRLEDGSPRASSTRWPRWTRRSILNVAHMGKFSSDRTIRQYADEVWRVARMKVE